MWQAASCGEEGTKGDYVATSSPGLSLFSMLWSWLPLALVLLLAATVTTLSFSFGATLDQPGMETFGSAVVINATSGFSSLFPPFGDVALETDQIPSQLLQFEPQELCSLEPEQLACFSLLLSNKEHDPSTITSCGHHAAADSLGNMSGAPSGFHHKSSCQFTKPECNSNVPQVGASVSECFLPVQVQSPEQSHHPHP